MPKFLTQTKDNKRAGVEVTAPTPEIAQVANKPFQPTTKVIGKHILTIPTKKKTK